MLFFVVEGIGVRFRCRGCLLFRWPPKVSQYSGSIPLKLLQTDRFCLTMARPFGAKFDAAGRLQDQAYIKRIDQFLKELIWMARVLRYGRENIPLE